MPGKNDLKIEKIVLSALSSCCWACGRSEGPLTRILNLTICSFRQDCGNDKKWQKFVSSPAWSNATDKWENIEEFVDGKWCYKYRE